MRISIMEGVAGARGASGCVVVSDVLRAFTTAAYAFDAGITEIELLSTVEEAFVRPGFRMGDVDCPVQRNPFRQCVMSRRGAIAFQTLQSPRRVREAMRRSTEWVCLPASPPRASSRRAAGPVRFRS